DYEQFDLLHFYNITRPDIILHHIERSKKPFVLSTIYMDYSHYKTTEVRPLVRLVSYIVNKHGIEYFKAMYKHLKGTETILSKKYFIQGQKKSIKNILNP